jgi:hypothetical protein
MAVPSSSMVKWRKTAPPLHSGTCQQPSKPATPLGQFKGRIIEPVSEK